MSEPSGETPYETYASMIAPAAAGCALGMIFGRSMGRGMANFVGLALLAASAVIAAPVLTGAVQRAANRPSSERGSRRRLEGIRNSAVPTMADDFFVDSPNSLLPE